MSEPLIPAELWMLWVNNSDVERADCWCAAIDEVGTPDLVFTNLADAMESAGYHAEHYYIKCKPIRVK